MTEAPVLADVAPVATALLHAVIGAVGDPGSIVRRGDFGTGPRDESVPDWKARAVLEAVRPFVAVLDDSDRPHVEEARRILAAFGEGRPLPAPASYGRLRALYDAGRTLLGILDKIAPAERAR